MGLKRKERLYLLAVSIPASVFLSYKIFRLILEAILKNYSSKITEKELHESKLILESFSGFIGGLKNSSNLVVYFILFGLSFIAVFSVAKFAYKVLRMPVINLLRSFGINILNRKNNDLPDDLVKTIVVNMGESLPAVQLEYLREEFLQCMKRTISNNPALQRAYYIEGYIISPVRFYGGKTSTFKIRSRSGNEIQVYVQDRSILKSHINTGNFVGVRGYLQIYEQAFWKGFDFLQLKAVEVRNIAAISNDCRPLHSYILNSKFKQKLSFLFTRKYRIALITSAGSEARADIGNCLGKYRKFNIEEKHVNLYSPTDIADAITKADTEGNYHAIIIARGGTDNIDVFNDYIILNAIFKSRTLVISAIGHASNNPLSNIVADIAEDTPSAAARYIEFKYKNFRKNTAILVVALSILSILVFKLKN